MREIIKDKTTSYVRRIFLEVCKNIPLIMFCVAFLFVLKVGIFAFSPFIVGVIFSYLLIPSVDYFEKKGFSRGLVSGVLVFISFILVVGLIFLIFPALYEKIRMIILYISKNSNSIKAKFKEISLLLSSNFGIEVLDVSLLESFFEKVSNSVNVLVSKVWLSSGKVITLLSMFFVSPVIIFYMVRDWRLIHKKTKELVPMRYRNDFEELTNILDVSFKSYVRGQIQICIILGVFYGVIVWTTGLVWGFFVGFCVGFASIIPFLGYTIGVIFSLIIALMQFGSDWIRIGLVFFALCMGQLIEGNFITPRIMAGNFQIHPVWVMLGLFSCVEFFGTPGALLALPIVAIIKSFSVFFLKKYKNSYYFKAVLNSENQKEVL